MIATHLGVGYALGGILSILFPSISEKIDSYRGYDINYINQIRPIYEAAHKKANFFAIIIGVLIYFVGKYFERFSIVYSSKVDVYLILITLLIHQFIIIRPLKKTLHKSGYNKKQSEI